MATISEFRQAEARAFVMRQLLALMPDVARREAWLEMARPDLAGLSPSQAIAAGNTGSVLDVIEGWAGSWPSVLVGDGPR